MSAKQITLAFITALTFAIAGAVVAKPGNGGGGGGNGGGGGGPGGGGSSNETPLNLTFCDTLSGAEHRGVIFDGDARIVGDVPDAATHPKCAFPYTPTLPADATSSTFQHDVDGVSVAVNENCDIKFSTMNSGKNPRGFFVFYDDPRVPIQTHAPAEEGMQNNHVIHEGDPEYPNQQPGIMAPGDAGPTQGGANWRVSVGGPRKNDILYKHHYGREACTQFAVEDDGLTDWWVERDADGDWIIEGAFANICITDPSAGDLMIPDVPVTFRVIAECQDPGNCPLTTGPVNCTPTELQPSQ